MTVAVQITTADANPTAAPYKVSKQAGRTIATVAINVTGTGPVRAYRMMRDSNAIIQGTELAMIGGICGISKVNTFKPTAIPTPANFSVPVTADQLGPEGNHAVGLYVRNGELFE